MSGVDRFLRAATVLGHQVEVRRFPQGTKTAPDAARAIGCDVGQIVKSLVFVADDLPVLVMTSGANRVDVGRLAALVAASEVRRASPDEVRSATGYAIGGTPPFNWSSRQPVTFIDEDLMRHDVVWAGAGAPDAVFAIAPSDLVRLSGGVVAAFAER